MTERKHLLHEIDKIGFAIDDVVLFLDTHPGDCKAMAFYQECCKRKKHLMKEYQEQFGPLHKDAAQDGSCFSWLDNPWPWEGGAC